jgi:hypothetical protein
MNKKMLAVMAIALSMVAGTATAQVRYELELGKKYGAQMLLCLQKADAIQVAEVLIKSGMDAAGAVFGSKEQCASLPAYATLKKVVFQGTASDGKQVFVIEATVELDDGKVATIYVLTPGPVKGYRTV